MNNVVDLTIPAELDRTGSLPALVERAAKALAGAKNAAEILEARETAAAIYDLAKRQARLAKAKNAHDEVLAKVHRAQADALEIEAGAKRRLADEYDAAQERGEVAKDGQHRAVPDGNSRATTDDIGLSRKDIHEAREIRDAEESDPGIVKRTLDEAVESGEEPTRAKVRRVTRSTVGKEDKPLRPTRGPRAIAGRVRDAIVALNGLPSASEVAGYIRGTDDEILIEENLLAAADWLAEFAEEWTQ